MRRIVQLELTNHCNRKCSYCGQVNMTRPKGFMSMATLDRCLDILGVLAQTSVGLNHYGESTMHPGFFEFLAHANHRGVVPWLYTNGDNLDTAFITRLAQYKLESLVISGHMQVDKRQAVAAECIAHGIKACAQVTLDNPLSIAGQVGVETGTPLADPMRHCRFLADEWAIVCWDGTLVPCCYDYDGKAPFGNIHDDGAIHLSPSVSALCATCPGHPGNTI